MYSCNRLKKMVMRGEAYDLHKGGFKDAKVGSSVAVLPCLSFRTLNA